MSSVKLWYHSNLSIENSRDSRQNLKEKYVSNNVCTFYDNISNFGETNDKKNSFFLEEKSNLNDETLFVTIQNLQTNQNNH